MSSSVLEARDVSLAYGANVLLEGASFNIRPQEVCAVRGPNGSGKTSLLKTLIGLRNPNSGRVLRETNLRIGYVPQLRSLDPAFPVSVRALLKMSFPGLRYLTSPAARRERAVVIETILEEVGIPEDVRRRQIRECSGGEFQRALIGRALALQPQLLVLDEPTASLDYEGKEQLLALLQRVHRQRSVTILLTSHDLNLSAEFFTTHLEIFRGGLQVERRSDKA